MSVTVKLHLPVPEGRPGDVVELSQERAAALVDRRYASYVAGGSAGPDPAPVTEPVATPEVTDSAASPVTELPNVNDAKAEWVKAAEALGLDTEGLTKAEVVEAVQAATG